MLHYHYLLNFISIAFLFIRTYESTNYQDTDCFYNTNSAPITQTTQQVQISGPIHLYSPKAYNLIGEPMMIMLQKNSIHPFLHGPYSIKHLFQRFPHQAYTEASQIDPVPAYEREIKQQTFSLMTQNRTSRFIACSQSVCNYIHSSSS